MRSYPYLVTVTTDLNQHADQVITERLGHDEDYGFDYRVEHDSLDATTENLRAALRNLESARSLIDLEFGPLTGISPELDSVSHFIQEAFTSLGLEQPHLT